MKPEETEIKEETSKREYEKPTIVSFSNSGFSCKVGGGDGWTCCAGRSVTDW